MKEFILVLSMWGSDGIKYGEWSQEYMNDFINSFEENKRKKRVRKAVDEVIK